MRPLYFALGSMLCYAIFNLLVPKYLLKVHALVTMTVGSAIVVIIGAAAIALCRTTGLTKIEMSTRTEWIVLIACGIVLFWAEFFYVSAYTANGKLVVITTCIILIPVVAALFKVMTGGKAPSWLELVGWAFAAVGVLIMVIAQQADQPPDPPIPPP